MPDREPRDVLGEALDRLAEHTFNLSVIRPGDALLIYRDEAGNIRQRIVPQEEYLAPRLAEAGYRIVEGD